VASKRNSELTYALRNKLLIKFWNPYDSGSTNGYVLDIGPRFFLLGLVDGNFLEFNGFQCLRLSDIRKLQVPDPHSKFFVKALRKRGQRIPRRPRIDMRSLPGLLNSANRLFPLVTVHRERVTPGTCKIGRVTGITKSQVSLLEIGPDAVWDKEPSEIRLGEITRIEFGGGYEEALHLVGGRPKRTRKPAVPNKQ
jgi:hypothetical protein